MNNNHCAGFGVIKASRKDTTETLRQVLIHNQTYRQICGDMPKSEKPDE